MRRRPRRRTTGWCRSAEVTVVADGDIGQTLGAALLGPFLPRVELTTRLVGSTRHDDAANVIGLEDPKRRVGEILGEFDEFEIETQIWFVGSESAHGIGVRHAGNLRDVVSADLGPQGAHDSFPDINDVLLFDETHLDVELSEFRLAVGAKIFIAVTPSNLEIPLDSSDHEQLLEQLGRLRERVPVAGLQAHGHEEVSRSLGGGSGQRGGFNLHEVTIQEHRAGHLIDARTHTNRVTPVTWMQNSSRSGCATADSRTTTWARPDASRRSKNATPPWSRRDAIHPARVTMRPASVSRISPASSVLITTFPSVTNELPRRLSMTAR